MNLLGMLDLMIVCGKSNDAEMATGFGESAAIALQNSRDLEQRKTAEKQHEKVRDDSRIEAYIQEYSDAQFSHSM